MDYHLPVMPNEAINNLKVTGGMVYVDATLGDGGHTIELLKRGATVVGIDIEDQSLARATARIVKLGLEKNFVGVHGNFKDIDTLVHQCGYDKVAGVLLDLGYSSFQLDEGGLGLSFQRDEPLDMRLDQSLGVTAADLVNSLDEYQLAHLIRDYSDEKLANKFARAIVNARCLKKLQSTGELVKILSDVASPGYEHGRINPATRTFQALRIAVNLELDNLESALPRAARLLLPGGRLVVISFHSLEDRLVKNFGRSAQPYMTSVTKKPIDPTDLEVAGNSRARSAKMRVFEHI